MKLDELRERIKKICEEGRDRDWRVRDPNIKSKLILLFEEHREEVFELSKPADHYYASYPADFYPKWTAFEREISENLPDLYHSLRSNAIAFFTCSCGSREDSCPEDGEGNFSTFAFMPDGDVFRITEKKS